MFVTKLHNITAVPIPKGIRFDLSVELSGQSGSGILPEREREEILDTSLATSSFHRQEIRAGDHIAWTIETNGWPTAGGDLQTNVSFRDMESETTTLQWIRQPATSTKAALSNVAEGDEENAEDDFSTGNGSSSAGFWDSEAEAEEEGDELCDMVLAGEPLSIPPSIVLQPCPLVFFGSAQGDESAFRFLWSQLPHSSEPISVTSRNNSAGNNGSGPTAGCAAREIARLSKVDLSDDTGNSTDGWAFASWSSKRLLCLLTTKANLEGALYVRGDSNSLIKSVVGSQKDRAMFVSDLTNGRFGLFDS